MSEKDFDPDAELELWTPLIRRSYVLDDLAVRSGKITCDSCGQDATGRLVDAYAAVFDTEAEIHDNHGHYYEQLDRSAFNKRVSDLQRSRAGVRAVGVFYHHGKTLYGTPSEQGSIPVGHPAAIRVDGRGVLTTTHYGTTGFAGTILQTIKDGDIGGYSFTGRIIRSNPDRVPRATRGGTPPLVTRMEMGLSEYGPTPLPFYEDAQVLAVRSIAMDVESTVDSSHDTPTPQEGAGAEEPLTEHSGRFDYQRRIHSRFPDLGANHGQGSS